MIVPPALSATWFGPNERTMSTAVSSMANCLGGPLGFLLGLIVHDKQSMFTVMAGEALFCLLLCTFTLVYFPKEPPSPPSNSSAVKQQDMIAYKEGIAPKTSFARDALTITTSWGPLIVILCAGACSGLYGAWSAMSVGIFQSLGYSQEQAQWVGVLAGLASVSSGLVSGYIHDKFKHFKGMLVGIYFCLGLAFVGIIVMTNGLIPQPQFLVFATVCIIGGGLSGAFYPLVYEALAELTYPIPEGIGAGILAFMMNFGSFVLLIVGDYIHTNAINWIVMSSAMVSAIFSLTIRQKYKRSFVDDTGYLEVQ